MFKPGDTVRLRSGGPVMTVEFVEGEKTWCLWFDNLDVKRHQFRAAALEAA